MYVSVCDVCVCSKYVQVRGGEMKDEGGCGV